MDRCRAGCKGCGVAANDREALRATFDTAADLYHRARPRYPAEVFDLVDAAVGSRLGGAQTLEVGPATGIATVELASRGHRVTAIELGSELADRARHETADHDVEVITGSFDTWEPPEWQSFDLIVAATSWHWLDPETRWERAHRHLRPSGVLALWSAQHVFPVGGDPFFVDIQPVYDELGESVPDDWVFPQPGDLPEYRDEIEASGLFVDVEVTHVDWELTYDADSYCALLDTFSGHIAMGPTKRAHLYGEIRRRLAERPDGLLRRHWGAAVHTAQGSPLS